MYTNLTRLSTWLLAGIKLHPVLQDVPSEFKLAGPVSIIMQKHRSAIMTGPSGK